MSKNPTTTTTVPGSVAPPPPPPTTATTTTTLPGSLSTPTATPTGAGVLTLPTVGGASGTGYSVKLTLPSASALMQAGVPQNLAVKMGGQSLTVGTSSSQKVSGDGLLGAINSLQPDSITGLKMSGQEIQQATTGLHNFFAIPQAGDERAILQASTFAASYIPTDGNLSYVNSAELYQVNALSQSAKAANAQAIQLQATYGNGLIAAQTAATASAKYGAQATVEADLTNWGIDTPEMNKVIARMAASGVTNVNEILSQVRQSPEYQKAFPALAQYNSQPGVVHMTETEYRSYSQAIIGTAQQYGIPPSFVTQDEIGKLLEGRVSPNEFQQRAQDIYTEYRNSDQTTRNTLAEQGITPSHLMQYWANPQQALPIMQRQVAAAQIGDYANRVGLSQGLTEGARNQLADMAKLASTHGNSTMGAGVSTIEQSLLTASRDSALLKSNPGAGTPNISTNTLIGSQIAGFQGTNQQAAQITVGRAESARAAPFDRGGGYAENARGVLGVGSSST